MKKKLKKKLKNSSKAVRYFSGEFVNIGKHLDISLDGGISYTKCQLTCES